MTGLKHIRGSGAGFVKSHGYASVPLWNRITPYPKATSVSQTVYRSEVNTYSRVVCPLPILLWPFCSCLRHFLQLAKCFVSQYLEGKPRKIYCTCADLVLNTDTGVHGVGVLTPPLSRTSAPATLVNFSMELPIVNMQIYP